MGDRFKMKFSNNDTVNRKFEFSGCTYNEALEILKLCKLPEKTVGHNIYVRQEYNSELWAVTVAWEADKNTEDGIDLTLDLVKEKISVLAEEYDG